MFIVNIMGGLGNQLFQYNFALYLKDKFPSAKVKLNKRYFKNDSIHGGFQLGNVVFPIEQKKHKWASVTDETFDCAAINATDDVVFDGYWQNYIFFDRQYFSFSDLYKIPSDEKNRHWADLITNSKNSVSVHVRCGDYNNHFLLGNIATRSYFNNAVAECLKQNPASEFFVFSDDKDWASKNINFSNAKVYFVDGNDSPNKNKYDLYLMSLCKQNILSNSTFSWWAYQFNLYSEKSAVVPPYWVNEKAISFPNIVSNIQKLPSMHSVSNIPFNNEKPASPLFSVVLSAYNQEDCIHRALSSILNQSFKNFELIAVDDGSTDKTLAVLNEYAGIDARITVIEHDKNLSSLAARKTGVKNARGKYILFLDGDDYFVADAFNHLYLDIVEKTPDFDVCEFTFARCPKGIYDYPHEYDKSISRVEYFLREDCHVTVWNKLYNAEMLKRVFLQMADAYVNLGDDTCESVCIALYTKNFIQKRILVTNYLECTGISTTKCSMISLINNCASIKRAVEVIYDFYKKEGLTEKAELLSNAAEKRLFAWVLARSYDLNSDEERVRFYYELPQYFSEELIIDTLKKVYDGSKKYQQGKFSVKNFMRRIYRALKKQAKRIPFVRNLYAYLKKIVMGGGTPA